MAHGDDGDGDIKDHQHFRDQALKDFKGGNKAGSAWNMTAVGHNDLGARGFNGDVWVHDEHAYVGHWGFGDWATGNSRFCPTAPFNGVAVVDVADPRSRSACDAERRRLVLEDVVAYTARAGGFAGKDIAVAGIQDCAGSRYEPDPNDRGLQLWDVTDAAHPVPLGFVTPAAARGVLQFEVQHRPDLGRAFAYATCRRRAIRTRRLSATAMPTVGELPSLRHHGSDEPVQVSSWGIQDIGGPFTAGQGCDADANYGHGAEPSTTGSSSSSPIGTAASSGWT